MTRRCLHLLLWAGFAISALAVDPEPVAAATACWRTVLHDWYDGRLDGVEASGRAVRPGFRPPPSSSAVSRRY